MNRIEDVMGFMDWYQSKGRMPKFWECYVEGTDGGRHYRHYDIASAEKEAERLARLPSVQGKRVFLYECVGRCQAEPAPVKWEIPR